MARFGAPYCWCDLLCCAVLQEGAGGDGEIDLGEVDKEGDADAKGKKRKGQRFERYEDDFIDDSEIEMVKGGPKVKTRFTGFYINKVRHAPHLHLYSTLYLFPAAFVRYKHRECIYYNMHAMLVALCAHWCEQCAPQAGFSACRREGFSAWKNLRGLCKGPEMRRSVLDTSCDVGRLMRWHSAAGQFGGH